MSHKLLFWGGVAMTAASGPGMSHPVLIVAGCLAVIAAIILTDNPTLPASRFVGTSEIWRENGTGVRAVWLLWFPIWAKPFHHSTAWFD